MADIRTAPIDGYLRDLTRNLATDLLISVGSPPRIRVDGELRALDVPEIREDDVEQLVI